MKKYFFLVIFLVILSFSNLIAQKTTYNDKSNSDLIEASRDGNMEIVKSLLNGGADIEAKENDGFTALYWASQEGHTEIVEILKAAGATQ